MKISKHETLWLQSEGAKMLMNLGIKQGGKIIDYGCGKGRYTIPLSQIVGKEGCVYSVEKNEDSIIFAKERLTMFSNPDVVKFIKNDNLETTDLITKKSINAIFAFDVLQYVKNWDLLFKYFYGILNPNGIVCIYPAAIPHPGQVDMKLLISKMEKIGFQYLESKKYRMMHNMDIVDDVVYSFCLK